MTFYSASFQQSVYTFRTQICLFSNYHFSPPWLGVSLLKRHQQAPSSALSPPSCNAPIWLAFLRAFAWTSVEETEEIYLRRNPDWAVSWESLCETQLTKIYAWTLPRGHLLSLTTSNELRGKARASLRALRLSITWTALTFSESHAPPSRILVQVLCRPRKQHFQCEIKLDDHCSKVFSR